MQLRNISEQVMVITGATSGIGLTTARMAAEQGAQLMLVARNEEALRQLTEEINGNGGFAAYHATDVAEEGGLREAARKAVTEFGRIDTWVNNAGGSIYGRILDVSVDDLRRVFETNVWGVVYGSRIAAEYLREQGGAIINVGSEVSDAPVPLQGIYSASKHAVKGFTDALRIELEADGLPISVTLIKPTAIHTPFTENAKNYLPYEPQLPSPLYAPELVAEAILHSAENPTRDFFVGEMAKLHSSMALNMPRLYDKFNESNIDSMQNSGEPARINRPDGLHETNSRLRERGSDDRFVLEESLYQRAKIHPLLTAGFLAGSGLAIAALVRSRTSRSSRHEWQTDDGVRLQRNTPRQTLGMNMGSTAGRNMDSTVGRNIETRNTDISEHMEVIGSDGGHVGTVDKVEGDQIKLTKDDSPDGRHHRISMNDVHAVNQNRVMLAHSNRGEGKLAIRLKTGPDAGECMGIGTETKPVPSANGISMDEALRVIAASRKKAEEIGVMMNIAVVDAGGNLTAFGKMDGAWGGSIDIAKNKAYTARTFDMTTEALGQISQPGEMCYGIHASNDLRVIIFGGGIPLVRNGRVMGAVGVSGGTVPQDIEVAEAGVSAFGNG